MLDNLIKYFAKSLTKIEDERYRKCYMVKAKLERLSSRNEKYSHKVHIEKSKHRFSKIVSEAYSNNNLLAKLTIDLVNYKDSDGNFKVRKEEELDSLEYWTTISKEEVVKFSQYTKDINLIHLSDKPIVQGLLILMYLSRLVKEFMEITIKFIRPIYSEENIYIKREKNIILGYVNNILCFQCNFTEDTKMGELI